MELGNQIKALRLQRGATQEALAQHLNVSPQAVSKWEREAALPDVQLLPAISAYFGVTIDALFALTDDTRMERIQNMLWDERVLDPAVVELDRAFLLEKARREPDNGRPHQLLADLENHLAEEHRARAAQYAQESLARDPMCKGVHDELVHAMGGRLADWCYTNHRELIRWYEARVWLARMEPVDGTFRTPLYRGLIAQAAGDHDGAMAVWEQMCRDWPGEWSVWWSMGDVMARAGRYGEAKERYRRAFELQPAPKYVDSLESIAQVCQLEGDIPGAIAALEEEVAVLAEQWDTRTGETVDKVRREIARLKAL